MQSKILSWLLVPAGVLAYSQGAEARIPISAVLVPSINNACTPPTTNLGELLVTTGNGVIGEWGASLDALSAGPLKTDLLARLPQELDGPATAVPNANDRLAFLRNLRAPLPMSLPFAATMTGNQPRLVAGYLYDNGGSHRGHDYVRASTAAHPDPSFVVRAIADGKVIGVYWDGPPGGGGNTVVLEHTGKNGKKIYTFYMHMRNGRTHDIAAVKTIDCSGNADCVAYKAAANIVPPAPWWGTDADTIAVSPGDNVVQGQKLGTSGNTMTAIGHLDANGICSSADCNNHLHVYIGAPLDTNPKILTEVDGYGVYGEVSSTCYESVDNTTYFPRLFAAYQPQFFDLDFHTFTEVPELLYGMDYRPITLSFYDKNGAFDVAGSYDYSTDKSFLVWAGVQGSTLSPYVGSNQAWVPRETRIRLDSSGRVVYDATVALREAGESTEYRYHLAQGDLDTWYTEYVVNRGYGIGDLFPYVDSGVVRYAVLFTTNPKASNWMTYGRSEANAKTDINAIPGGLQVGQVIADTSTSPPRFSVLAKAAAGCAPHVYVNFDATTYEARRTAEEGVGYELERAQVYSNGTRFNAVYGRPSGQHCVAKP